MIPIALVNLPLNTNLKHDPPAPRLRAELTFYSDGFPSDGRKTARIDRWSMGGGPSKKSSTNENFPIEKRISLKRLWRKRRRRGKREDSIKAIESSKHRDIFGDGWKHDWNFRARNSWIVEKHRVLRAINRDNISILCVQEKKNFTQISALRLFYAFRYPSARDLIKKWKLLKR